LIQVSRLHAIALVSTLLLESTGMMFLSVLFLGRQSHWFRNGAIAVGVNLVTHTLFWYSLPLLPFDAANKLCGYEVAIALVEAVLYHHLCGFRGPQAGLVSLSLNLLSYSAGGWIWPYILR
jgi:hypothetical protein